MRIVLSGYYGFDNAGDEALLTAIVREIKRFKPDAEFTVLSGNPKRTSDVHGIRAVSRINPWVLLREIKKADLVLSGGGSLLQDVTGPLSIPYYLGIVALAKMLRKPVAFYAQGVGPVNGWLGKVLIRTVVNRVDLITLRDADSERLLKSLGVTKPPLVVTADPVFSLFPTPEQVEMGKNILSQMGLKERQVVGMALRDWHPEGERSLAAMSDLLAGKGYEILFIPFQYSEDLRVLQRVESYMLATPHFLTKQISSGELMGLVSNLQVLVGMRLHSLIFASVAGVPFAGIAYDPKVLSFLELFGERPLNEGRDMDPYEAAVRVELMLKERDERSLKIKEKIAKLKEKSRQTAMEVLGLVVDKS